MAASPPVAGTYRFVNLGCPKNLVDAERVAFLLEEDGWREAAPREEAALVVVTTCAFIASAREESVDEIVRAVEGRPAGQRIAVLGCLVTREKEEVLRRLLPEVDVFCGVPEMLELPRRLACGAARRHAGDRLAPPARRLFTPPHIAYLKIADGCSNRCAYCAIPAIRGDLRSRPREEILAEAEGLAGRGVRELVVVAQDTTAWGFDRPGEGSLYDLLESLADMGRFDWIRLLYAHPAHLDASRIAPLIKGGALVPYLDVPVQHAADRVLELMGRPYGRRELEALFDALRSSVDDLVLRTTVMVGHPGEREADFRELADFLESVSFDHVGVFAYSRESGTRSADIAARVPARVAARRRDELLERQMDVSQERLAARAGREVELLVDGPVPAEERPGANILCAGRFFGQAFEIDGVTYVRGEAREPGRLLRARIVETGPYDLFAEELPGDFR